MTAGVYRVVHLDELTESRPRGFVVHGQSVMVVKVLGTPHALVDMCPGDGASLVNATIDHGVVRCSCGWTIHLPDGQSTATDAHDDSYSPVLLPTRLTADNWVEVESRD